MAADKGQLIGNCFLAMGLHLQNLEKQFLRVNVQSDLDFFKARAQLVFFRASNNC